MIRIAGIRPDVMAGERVKSNAPRLNAEWIELFNAGGRAVDVSGYFVVNGRGESFTITLPRRRTLVLEPGQSLIIFSGFPDDAADPAACYLAHQAARLFLKRDSYFWHPDEDSAHLYTSRASYFGNQENYVDSYQYKRRSAKVIIDPGR